MSWFQKLSRKAVDSVKETTKEDAKEKLDIFWDSLKILAILGITASALKGSSAHAIDIPQPRLTTSPNPDTVVNIFLSTGGDVK